MRCLFWWLCPHTALRRYVCRSIEPSHYFCVYRQNVPRLFRDVPLTGRFKCNDEHKVVRRAGMRRPATRVRNTITSSCSTSGSTVDVDTGELAPAVELRKSHRLVSWSGRRLFDAYPRTLVRSLLPDMCSMAPGVRRPYAGCSREMPRKRGVSRGCRLTFTASHFGSAEASLRVGRML